MRRTTLAICTLLLPIAVAAGPDAAPEGSQWTGLWRMLQLSDYNSQVVLLGTAMLGLAAGLIGSFLLLRKRSLMGDAVSHATLPGIGIAFLIMVQILSGDSAVAAFLRRHDLNEKSLPILLAGALISGLLGMGVVLLIRKVTRLKEDVALGVVLSVFFGAGTSILVVTQQLPKGSAAGLDRFIFGRAASMIRSDAILITVAAALIAVAALLLFKEFTILCFDSDFAASEGWPVGLLDTLLMGLAVMVTVIGLQSVGMILVIALLIIPPAAARFWTHRLKPMVWISGITGALSAFVGAFISGIQPDLPTGALIVLTATAFFVFSLIVGTDRGVARRVIDHWQLTRKVARQNLLRALYESREHGPDPTPDDPLGIGVAVADLERRRSWTPAQLSRQLQAAGRDGLIRRGTDSLWYFTQSGLVEARRIVRNHRLWEIFLITHADIAPGRVDRDADAIEHVLGPELTSELETLLAAEQPDLAVPPSPHIVQAQP